MEEIPMPAGAVTPAMPAQDGILPTQRAGIKPGDVIEFEGRRFVVEASYLEPNGRGVAAWGLRELSPDDSTESGEPKEEQG